MLGSVPISSYLKDFWVASHTSHRQPCPGLQRRELCSLCWQSGLRGSLSVAVDPGVSALGFALEGRTLLPGLHLPPPVCRPACRGPQRQPGWDRARSHRANGPLLLTTPILGNGDLLRFSGQGEAWQSSPCPSCERKGQTLWGRARNW